MKSLDDLKKLRDEVQASMHMRSDIEIKYRVIVAMATCGIQAGARNVLKQFVEDVAQYDLPVTILQNGCVNACQKEPIVEVIDQNNHKTTYVNVDVEKVHEIVQKHLINNQIINEYTLENNQE